MVSCSRMRSCSSRPPRAIAEPLVMSERGSQIRAALHDRAARLAQQLAVPPPDLRRTANVADLVDRLVHRWNIGPARRLGHRHSRNLVAGHWACGFTRRRGERPRTRRTAALHLTRRTRSRGEEPWETGHYSRVDIFSSQPIVFSLSCGAAPRSAAQRLSAVAVLSCGSSPRLGSSSAPSARNHGQRRLHAGA